MSPSVIQTKYELRDAQPDGETLLHVAVEAIKVEAVKEIIEVPHFNVNAENTSGKTALELVIQKSLDRRVRADNARSFRNIERVLLGHDKVNAFVDRLYRERQVNVDAANAILLGAALIATITFSTWFTFPLPQDTSTNAPSPQVPSTNARAIEVFWVLNSLSFFFSVATVLAAAYATAPIFHHPFIGLVVRIVYIVELTGGAQKLESPIGQIEKIFRCVKKIGNKILGPVFKALQALRQLILSVCQRSRRDVPV
jgi:hypothetical protein